MQFRDKAGQGSPDPRRTYSEDYLESHNRTGKWDSFGAE
jgi:hypothetical protein